MVNVHPSTSVIGSLQQIPLAFRSGIHLQTISDLGLGLYMHYYTPHHDNIQKNMSEE